ncbi:MAG: DUF3160 domain-containing protein [Pirellulaceae bacterium]|nr:DUF3160 domain-containing protein [Pirellulaceae bacterium]
MFPAKLSARLRTLAEKQLKNERFDQDDRDFIVSYGRYLAPLMFHSPSPSATPRDDVPRIVDVFSNPLDGRCMEVGVGRPRIIYVLYPTERGEVLCRGAILPYFEFLSPKRLNDVEWKQMLDSPDAPAQPEWLTSWGPEPDVPTQAEPTTSRSGVAWGNRVGVLVGAAVAILLALWFTGRRLRVSHDAARR